ncbi:hypothetical protein D3C80_1800890 [compost metagenome]
MRSDVDLPEPVGPDMMMTPSGVTSMRFISPCCAGRKPSAVRSGTLSPSSGRIRITTYSPNSVGVWA